MDYTVVDMTFDTYPKLEVFVSTGTISLKLSRQLLGVDRYKMYELFQQLVEAGAVYPSGSNCFRATQELRDYILTRREKKLGAWANE